MNQADKEYLQKKGLLRKDETAVDWAIQEAAMKEAVIFAGALLEKGNGVMELQTISLYLDELAAKRHFMHVHLYVQHVFRNCRPDRGLEYLDVASLHEEVLFLYVTYFVFHLGMLVNRMNEVKKSLDVSKIIAGQNMKAATGAQKTAPGKGVQKK